MEYVFICFRASRKYFFGNGFRQSHPWKAFRYESPRSIARISSIASKSIPRSRFKPIQLVSGTALVYIAKEAQQGENLYQEGDKDKVYKFLVDANISHPNDPEILWRLARACHDLALNKSLPLEHRKKLISESHQYATRAMELAPDNYATHKWFAITLKDTNEFEGTTASLKNAFTIREHFEKSIQLNPKDPTSYYLMGAWCAYFADMSWTTRKLASAIFATPPTATYEEAFRFFQKAEELEPGFYKANLVSGAEMLIKLGKKDQSKEWLQKAIALPIRNLADENAHVEALKLFKSM